MKTGITLGFTILIFCLACQQKELTPKKEKPDYVVLTGTIKNYNGAVLKIQDFMGRSNWETEIEIKNGSFSTNLFVDKPTITMLSFGRTFKDIFLQPGETLNVSFILKIFVQFFFLD